MNTSPNNRDLRQGPPRQLNPLTQISILMGGFQVMFGSIFFWFGMIFVQVFVLQSELVYLFAFDGEWIQTKGVITSIESTGATHNDYPILEYAFSFTTNDGQTLQGFSYDAFSDFNTNATVDIEYKSKDFNRSRIVGTSNSMIPSFVGFVIIFPLIGFVFMVIGIRKNNKALHILRNGIFTRGKMLSYEATNTSINERRVYAYEFGFEANGKSYIATGETHLTERVEDEELEKILYHPTRPEENIIYDTFTNLPNINKFGQLEQAGISSLGSLLPTIIGIIVNGSIYYFMLL